MSINWLDIVILVILSAVTYWGWKAGLTGEVFRFLGVMAALFCAFRFTHGLADELYGWVKVPIVFLRLFSFVLIMTLGYIFVQVMKLAMQKHEKSTNVYDCIEHFGGAGVALLKGSIAIFVLLVLLGSLPSQKLSGQIKRIAHIWLRG